MNTAGRPGQTTAATYAHVFGPCCDWHADDFAQLVADHNRLMAERDQLREALTESELADAAYHLSNMADRAFKAEAERDRMRAALERIAGATEITGNVVALAMVQVARAALAGGNGFDPAD